MVIINDLGKPRKWAMLEKYDLQWPSHCQLTGPENWIVLREIFFVCGYLPIGSSFCGSSKFPALARGIGFPELELLSLCCRECL
jgi:hypothetical protein